VRPSRQPVPARCWHSGPRQAYPPLLLGGGSAAEAGGDHVRLTGGIYLGLLLGRGSPGAARGGKCHPAARAVLGASQRLRASFRGAATTTLREVLASFRVAYSAKNSQRSSFRVSIAKIESIERNREN